MIAPAALLAVGPRLLSEGGREAARPIPSVVGWLADAAIYEIASSYFPVKT